ncbi:proline racemase [Liquorilactobacillus uvarum DSM 19971]|uniref:Proline racemase n=1 Tax=Liquorilactobacillus uvarum DSM 19971 TaxID=1423812 RepID=A0A0R1QB69_9LACO|nr:proline racemase [Liquorilactobacillus uvarum DSM 19971]
MIIGLLLQKCNLGKEGDILYFERTISAIDSHTAGESARLVISGMPPMKGSTIAEKREYMQKKYDTLRCAIMHEPRGHKNMFGAILLESTEDAADFGIIFMDSQGYLNMCGHNTIAAVTIIIETGMVDLLPQKNYQMKRITLSTPAGLVKADAEIVSNRVKSVTFKNVISFLYKRDQVLILPGIGEIYYDISFGGSFFILVDVAQMPFEIQAAEAATIIKWGLKIRNLVNNSVSIQHPVLKHIKTADLVEFYQENLSGEVIKVKNVVVFGNGQIDRSPCGTGTSAKIAILAAQNKLKLGQTLINESILGTKFQGKFVQRAEIAPGVAGVIPEIKGSSFITGFNRFVIDPEDPLKNGFEL